MVGWLSMQVNIAWLDDDGVCDGGDTRDDHDDDNDGGDGPHGWLTINASQYSLTGSMQAWPSHPMFYTLVHNTV